jgi:putative SOS response-associated peptidase YedK
MPARGWYEWNENEQVRNEGGRKVKQLYFISLPDSGKDGLRLGP